MSPSNAKKLAASIATELRLRNELRDAIQTLSDARRAEVWEIVNKMLELWANTPEDA